MQAVTIGKLFCAMVLSVLAVASAEALVLDFEDLAQPGGDTTYVGSGYAADGYVITSNIDPIFADQAFGSWQSGNVHFNGSTALFNAITLGPAEGGTTTLRREDGTAFALESVDLGQLFSDSGSETEVVFVGTKSDGNTVSASFLLPAELMPVTYLFQDTFVDLVAVRWEQFPQFHQFDNVVVTGAPVPEPASILLLLAGGVLLFCTVRHRT